MSDDGSNRPAARSSARSFAVLLALGVALPAAIGLWMVQDRRPPAGPYPGPPAADGSPHGPPAEAASSQREGEPRDLDVDHRPVQFGATDTDSDAPVPTERYEVTLRIERGDTLAKLLADVGVAPDENARAQAAFRTVHKGRGLPTGELVVLALQASTDQDAPPRLLQLAVRPEATRELTVTRTEDGSYDPQEKVYEVRPRMVRVAGVFAGGLRATGEAAGLAAPVLAEVARAFSFDVDFQRDVRNGDRFALLLEQGVTEDGRVVNPGRLLWAELALRGGPIAVVRFKPDGGAEQFYTAQGQSVVRSFLRTPMDLSRISSRFGMREHPILGFSALHAGVDFAAPAGTPILSAGAGTVEMAGWNGGYGNYVRIRHTREVATAYAHLSRYAPGIRPGATVRQGQVIGFVGSTGMSTGPHLHYEFHRNGVPVNPLAQKVSMRSSLAGRDLQRFQQRVAQLAQLRASAPALPPPAVPQTAQGPAGRTQ